MTTPERGDRPAAATSTGPRAEFVKADGELLMELLQSLAVIRDATNGMREGAEHQVIPLAGQLRAIVTDVARRNHALLLELIERYGGDDQVYAMAPVGHQEWPADLSPSFQVSGPPFSVVRVLAAQEQLSIEDLLVRPLLHADGVTFSMKSVIEYIANFAGGAHYSKRAPQMLHSLFLGANVDFSPRVALLNVLRQFGELVLAMGSRLIQELCNQDLVAVIRIGDQSPTGVLWDQRYEGTSMGLTIRVVSGQLNLLLTAINNVSLQIGLDRYIDWSRPHMIRVRLRNSLDGSSTCSLILDEAVNSDLTYIYPLFLVREWLHYERAINRTVADPTGADDRGVALNLFSVGALTQGDEGRVAYQVARTLHETWTAEGHEFVDFSASDFGTAARGQSDLDLHGSPSVQPAEPEALSGQSGNNPTT